jgi:hypothetical protein
MYMKGIFTVRTEKFLRFQQTPKLGRGRPRTNFPMKGDRLRKREIGEEICEKWMAGVLQPPPPPTPPNFIVILKKLNHKAHLCISVHDMVSQRVLND